MTMISILVCFFLSKHITCRLYFLQRKFWDQNGISNHDVYVLENICNIIIPVHALTDSDFTNLFYSQSKISVFKRLLINPNFYQILSSFSTDIIDITQVTKFILYIAYL